MLTLGGIGLILHCASLVQQIYTHAGVNLAFLPMISLMFLSVGAMVILSSLRRPIENLLIALFPLAAVAIIASLIFKDTYAPIATLSRRVRRPHHPVDHRRIACLPSPRLQALLLAFGDYELRHRRLSVMKALPPLQTMEGLLFELLWGGLIFLSASIATGFFYLGNKNAMAPGLVHHTVITLGALGCFRDSALGPLPVGLAWASRLALDTHRFCPARARLLRQQVRSRSGYRPYVNARGKGVRAFLTLPEAIATRGFQQQYEVCRPWTIPQPAPYWAPSSS
ncbi:MAG: hypothetical protein U5O39_01210 [Gammaproteobacteria bacterium]|nr:hypothetical protein [Gammaproteobacteria bacterium]